MLRLTRIRTTDRILFVICLMYLVTYIDRVNISTAAPAMQEELGLSNFELGMAFAAFAYPYALFQIFGGRLGDLLGPRKTLLICGTIWSAATIMIGFVEGAVSLIIARVLLGIGEGSAFPTATRALSSWMPSEKRGFAQGITHAFARFGNAITPPLIAVLIVAFSWRESFIIVGAISFAWVALWWWYFRDDPREHPGITPQELAVLPPPSVAAKQKNLPWGPLLRRMLPVTITDFCYGWTLWLFLNWIPSYFLHQHELDLKKSAIFAAGVFFAGVVGDLAGGWLSDGILRRTGRVTLARISVIILGFIGAFLCMLPVMFSTDLITVAISLSAAFFFAELIVAPIWATPMDIAPQYSGTASGFMNFGFGLAGMISPIIFGLIIDLTGRWDLPFAASLVLLLVGAATSLLIRPDRPFHDPSAGDAIDEDGGLSAAVKAK
ncbi:MFS transporter [Paracoccus laeviglucosivorans]|uniref:Sugar phosphate permease n=1 Tax=Paracoccus laeviglucosivorans TaxID=1197861 RepID=A0A521FVC4_9RHOB|nr:MFS transporter [Paracoccus laeviglucosivorans]SMO99491.1 Sugar phosphate permease [Paracoccus laeviglucosivorans]